MAGGAERVPAVSGQPELEVAHDSERGVPLVTRVLALQRAAGNRAVSALLRSRAPATQLMRNSLTDYRRANALRAAVSVMDMYRHLIARRGFGAGTPAHDLPSPQGAGGQPAEPERISRVNDSTIPLLSLRMATLERQFLQLNQQIVRLRTQRRSLGRGRKTAGTLALIEDIDTRVTAAEAQRTAIQEQIQMRQQQLGIARGGLRIGTPGSGGSRDAGDPHETNAGIQILNGNPRVGRPGRQVRMSFEVSRVIPGQAETEHAEQRILDMWTRTLESPRGAPSFDENFTPAHLDGATIVVVLEQFVCPRCRARLTAFAQRYRARLVVEYTVRAQRASGQPIRPRQALRNVYADDSDMPSVLQRDEIYRAPEAGPGNGQEPPAGGSPPPAQLRTPAEESGRSAPAEDDLRALEVGATVTLEPHGASAVPPVSVTTRVDEGAATGAALTLYTGAVRAANAAIGPEIELQLDARRHQIDGVRSANPGQGVLVVVNLSQDTPGWNVRPGLGAPYTRVDSISIGPTASTAAEALDAFTSVTSVSAGPTPAAVPRSPLVRYWWFPPGNGPGFEQVR
jgi:hypothetical protein